ncbi:unnamed protein product [Nesidiocoris tenuis]|uniref:Uncharacterized protein n=1 Tax=Nesidiocoris tenuis TaxID=355587 RepID=A0A6H5HMZ1_9HEMI|nr:unnamed protein product [Nesidiocoris tenuis]
MEVQEEKYAGPGAQNVRTSAEQRTTFCVSAQYQKDRYWDQQLHERECPTKPFYYPGVFCSINLIFESCETRKIVGNLTLIPTSSPASLYQTVFTGQSSQDSLHRIVLSVQSILDSISRAVFTRQSSPGSLYQRVFTWQSLPDHLYLCSGFLEEGFPPGDGGRSKTNPPFLEVVIGSADNRKQSPGRGVREGDSNLSRTRGFVSTVPTTISSKRWGGGHGPLRISHLTPRMASNAESAFRTEPRRTRFWDDLENLRGRVTAVRHRSKQKEPVRLRNVIERKIRMTRRRKKYEVTKNSLMKKCYRHCKAIPGFNLTLSTWNFRPDNCNILRIGHGVSGQHAMRSWRQWSAWLAALNAGKRSEFCRNSTRNHRRFAASQGEIRRLSGRKLEEFLEDENLAN